VTTKARAKATPKTKLKGVDSTSTSSATGGKIKSQANATRRAVTSRSRSASVKPIGDVEESGTGQEEGQTTEVLEEDKLYCVCKTRYDEDRFMIACDKLRSCFFAPEFILT
jgi:COMPASS component SPP1